MRHGPIAVQTGAPLNGSGACEVWSAALLLRDAARTYILAHNNEPDLAYESNAVRAD